MKRVIEKSELLKRVIEKSYWKELLKRVIERVNERSY